MNKPDETLDDIRDVYAEWWADDLDQVGGRPQWESLDKFDTILDAERARIWNEGFLLGVWWCQGGPDDLKNNPYDAG